MLKGDSFTREQRLADKTTEAEYAGEPLSGTDPRSEEAFTTGKMSAWTVHCDNTSWLATYQQIGTVNLAAIILGNIEVVIV